MNLMATIEVRSFRKIANHHNLEDKGGGIIFCVSIISGTIIDSFKLDDGSR